MRRCARPTWGPGIINSFGFLLKSRTRQSIASNGGAANPESGPLERKSTGTQDERERGRL